MATKTDFNATEWSTLVEAPVFAGVRIVGATRGGTIRESLAIGRVYAEARKRQGDSTLLDELVTSAPSLDPSAVKGGGDLASMATTRLREAVTLLEQKGDPQDVEAYKGFVVEVARAAAEAHKEGGFAGIGGQQISSEEQAALDEIAATLETGATGA